MPNEPTTPPAASDDKAARWHLRPLREILHREEEDLHWIIDNLLLAFSSLCCSGQPHSTKSLNWLCAAIESVTTRKVWNRFSVSDQVRNVLYIETEDHPTVVERRVRELCIGLGISYDKPPDGFHLATPGPFDLVRDGPSTIIKAIKDSKADWVVLSTLQGLLGGRDWNEQADMGPVNAALVEISRLCPLVLITHSPWNRKLKRPAGTITQAANYLTIMHFEKNLDESGQTITTAWVDGKLGESLEFKLSLNTEIGYDKRGKPRSELRSITYIQEDKKILIEQYLLANPDAETLAISLACDCTPQYVRKVRRLSLVEMSEQKRLV